MAGATVGVTSSSSSDVDRKTLEEASYDVVNESLIKAILEVLSVTNKRVK